MLLLYSYLCHIFMVNTTLQPEASLVWFDIRTGSMGKQHSLPLSNGNKIYLSAPLRLPHYMFFFCFYNLYKNMSLKRVMS